MAKKDLRGALGSIVGQYGFDTVAQALHEMKTAEIGPNVRRETIAPRRIRRTRRGPSRRWRSAVEYVKAMEIPAERAAVVRRAAEEFERRLFLPTVVEVRSFCEAYGIDEPKSKSRANGVPRIFKFLVTLEAADLEKILDDRLFSGPAELGPIADAIRDKAKQHRQEAIGRT